MLKEISNYLNFDFNARSSLPNVDDYNLQAFNSAAATNNISSVISSSALAISAFNQAENDTLTNPGDITGFIAPSIKAAFTAWTVLHAPSAQMASSAWNTYQLAFISDESRMVRGYKLLSEAVYISSIASNLMDAKYARQLRATSMIFQGTHEIAQALSATYTEYKNDTTSKANILVAIMQAAFGSFRLYGAYTLLAPEIEVWTILKSTEEEDYDQSLAEKRENGLTAVNEALESPSSEPQSVNLSMESTSSIEESYQKLTDAELSKINNQTGLDLHAVELDANNKVVFVEDCSSVEHAVFHFINEDDGRFIYPEELGTHDTIQTLHRSTFLSSNEDPIEAFTETDNGNGVMTINGSLASTLQDAYTYLVTGALNEDSSLIIKGKDYFRLCLSGLEEILEEQVSNPFSDPNQTDLLFLSLFVVFNIVLTV